MTIALITGSAGLIGAAAVRFFADKGLTPVGIDNDLRAYFFGQEASTAWSKEELIRRIPSYTHYDVDIRNQDELGKIFKQYRQDIKIVIHTAAQPSHDWAAKEPHTDFTVNANGTLNLLEMTRQYAPDAPFIFTSTNKVYGDTPNRLPFVEHTTRWELDPQHPYAAHGIDESMSIDQNLHSVFGASKVAADVLTQEYGRYFGMKTACFRGGCLTGSGHAGAELHGFLAYLVRCCLTGKEYNIFGYQGKQVRDNIHAWDLVHAFWHFFQSPRCGEVYNIGGGSYANCSLREAMALSEELTGREMRWNYQETNRIGDHRWWVSDIRKFQSHYPQWQLTYDIRKTLTEICEGLKNRL